MMRWMRTQLAKDEGFTLVELMVVVLIIAILIAIALPTFLGARKGAQDRAAQAQIRNGLVAEKAYYVDNETYTKTLADLQTLEPNIDPALTVTQNAAGAQAVCLELLSASGTWFSLWESAQDGTYYGSGAAALAACPDVGSPPAGFVTTGW